MENLDRQRFLIERREYIGASDISSVAGVGDWSCGRKLAYSKLDTAKDYDDSDRPEFRRGNRLESTACEYYMDITKRRTLKAKTVRKEGKSFLGVNMDRLVYKEGRDDPGYLEIKVVGRESYWQIKQKGIHDAYILQVQYGMSVANLKWGSFAVYWPDGDELLYWDFEKDEQLGKALEEKGEEFWIMHVYTKTLPDALPLGSKACKSCPWSYTCRKGMIGEEKLADVIVRDDLEAQAKELQEVAQEKKLLDAREKELKSGLIASIQEAPGTYKMGALLGSFKVAEQSRFDSTAFKKAQADVYGQFLKKSLVKTFKLTGEKDDE